MTDAPTLLPQHQELLAASAINSEVATARGYYSVTTKAELRRLGFSEAQRRTPALVLPTWDVFGQQSNYQIRPDEPRVNERGRLVKYEIPGKSRTTLDVPPSVRDRLGDPKTPLFITEGIRKADSAASIGLCCVDLLGVWNWRGTNDHGGKTALPDFEQIAFNTRDVFIVFDSDVMTKLEVHASLVRLKPLLEKRDADVFAVYLQAGSGGAKVGLDDYLSGQHGIDDLLTLATRELRRFPHDEDETGPYVSTPAGIVYRRPTRDGPVDQPLSNFTARITEDVIADDGAGERAELVIEGELGGEPLPGIRVPTRRFAALDWVSAWGARPIITAGMGNRDRLREAIQRLSPEIERRHVYEHPGWRNLPEHGWCYLHAGGAIGADGAIPGVDVALRGNASRILFPDLPGDSALRAALRTGLSLLDLGPDALTAPLWGAVYRAVLCEFVPADVSLFLVGPTGVYKSELAALAMQHVGAGFERLSLPASWSGTANALERAAFDFKDAPLVIDDFAPGGSQIDVARLHATADRVFRGAGNRSGRGRMNADGSLRTDYPPRGLIIGTGEDAPRGQSLRSRMMIVEVAPGDVCRERLTAAQDAARRGVFVGLLGRFIQYLAPQLEAMSVSLPAELAKHRDRAHQDSTHARTPEAVAHLAIGWSSFLRFAAASGAVTEAAAQATFARVWVALGEAAARQATHQASEEPARRFIELLRSALASGSAHVASASGGTPFPAEPWGWRHVLVAAGDYERHAWREQGVRVGWIEGEDLYLDLEAALTATQRVGQATGSGVAVGAKTLAKRLHERGFLRSIDAERTRLQVRRVLQGGRRSVLHLAASTVITQESAQPTQSAHGDGESTARRQSKAGNGPIPWADSVEAGQEPSQETGPFSAERRDEGPIGTVGTVFPA